MSDRSYFQIRIFQADPDPEVRSQILEALTEEGLDIEYDDAPDDVLQIGKQYTAEECTLDTFETLAGTLIGIDPTIAFWAWNDPKYEYLGGIAMHTPTLGLFTGDCDSNGNVVLSGQQIQELITDTNELIRRAGRPWEWELEIMRKEFTGS